MNSWVPKQPDDNSVIENTWGIATDANNFDASFLTEKNLLFPIPLSETSSNTNITQNQGY